MQLPNNGLLPASFRAVPFVVTNDDIGGGRRQVVHQYPGRDDPWAEDMGREARRFRFRGFIADGSVSFSGGPIILQRALLIAALERSGSGLLTHPVLGVRLRECSGVVAGLRDDPEVVFGSIDAIKLRSSMTLFLRADDSDPVFGQVLDQHFAGEPDPATDTLLGLTSGR